MRLIEDHSIPLGVAIFIFAMFWSIWFWTNFPAPYSTNEQLDKYCMNGDPMTEYCLGYQDGYEWYVQMLEAQNKIDDYFEAKGEEWQEDYDNIILN